MMSLVYDFTQPKLRVALLRVLWFMGVDTTEIQRLFAHTLVKLQERNEVDLQALLQEFIDAQSYLLYWRQIWADVDFKVKLARQNYLDRRALMRERALIAAAAIVAVQPMARDDILLTLKRVERDATQSTEALILAAMQAVLELQNQLAAYLQSRSGTYAKLSSAAAQSGLSLSRAELIAVQDTLVAALVIDRGQSATHRQKAAELFEPVSVGVDPLAFEAMQAHRFGGPDTDMGLMAQLHLAQLLRRHGFKIKATAHFLRHCQNDLCHMARCAEADPQYEQHLVARLADAEHALFDTMGHPERPSLVSGSGMMHAAALSARQQSAPEPSSCSTSQRKRHPWQVPKRPRLSPFEVR